MIELMILGFFVVLSFLYLLPDQAERDAVLRRRLDYLEQPASFFYDGDRPLRATDLTDPYRRGILFSARATSRAERSWIRELPDDATTQEDADAAGGLSFLSGPDSSCITGQSILVDGGMVFN